uniref:Secreted protein n=1 Tax=Globodera pallida TaxID=36090 RepID=A0A183BME2_GLOPA
MLMLLLLLFLSHSYPPIVSCLTYSLNATALDGLWHRAAVMALLRLQAKSLITELNLSTIERIVFKECEREAQKVVEMAKCVTKLLRRRESFDAKEKGEEQRKASNWAETEADERKKPKPREEPEFLLQRLFRVMKQALGGGEGTFAQFWMGGGGTTAQDKVKQNQKFIEAS